MRKLNNRIADGMSMLALVGMLMLGAGATPGEIEHGAPAKKSPAVHASLHIGPAHLVNPHLHGALPVVAKRVAREKKKIVARHWVGHWSFAGWAALHRGTGTIEGEVRSPSGSPVIAAHMVLRHIHGGIIRNWNAKHITTSGPGGTFIMRNVRIGSYRVRASKGKAAGATPIHVHGGMMTTVSVKI
jgi:hypothetical protein